MKIKIDTTAFKAALDEKKAQIQAATRPAAQAGAQVIYDHARLNLQDNSSTKGHWFHGTSFKKTGQKYWMPAGNLRDSIYQVYSKDNSDESKSTYHISWNASKAPYGFMVEFGTSRAGAHPFMGPAINDHKQEVTEAMRSKFIAGVK